MKVKKRDGKLEDFDGSKLKRGLMRSAATEKEAEAVLADVVKQLGDTPVVDARRLSVMVVDSLRNVNEHAADEFVAFREAKLRSR
jgi:transcriptional regulator NrdR family protein